MFKNLKKVDPEIWKSINDEIRRQEDKLELIASENYVSLAVLEALGSVMTNKYAEGYPSKRYYGGCEFVDVAEDLARDRAKKLFNAPAVNVQPHSGASANLGVYFACLNPGDTILGMDLSHGGHLTHGSPVSISGKWLNAAHYGVDPDSGLIDYDNVEKIAQESKPKLIVCGASAYSRKIDFERFRKIADGVGARLMADIAHPAGLVAMKLFPDPIPHCHYVTTTTHKTLRGPRGGMIMMQEDLEKEINKSIFPGLQGGPLMHVIAAKAVAFGEALKPDYKKYCEQIIKNAKKMCGVVMENGFNVVSNGTDSHLFMIDLGSDGVTGKDAEAALGRAGITVNKNTVPKETRSPFVASGIRIGTPAITTRGMKEAEMEIIGNWMCDVLKNPEDEKKQKNILAEVKKLCGKFPVYKELLADRG